MRTSPIFFVAAVTLACSARARGQPISGTNQAHCDRGDEPNAIVPWGAIFQISFENLKSRASEKREIPPDYFIVTDDRIESANDATLLDYFMSILNEL